MLLPAKYIEIRNDYFKNSVVSDWHQIISFEKIVINYINLQKQINHGSENSAK